MKIRRDLLALGILSTVLVSLLWREKKELRKIRSSLEAPAPEESFSDEGSPRVLFVGNSFTSVNDLPHALARIARSLGDPITVAAHAPGGQTLDGHSRDPSALEKIRERDWDFVVLQEQSQRPAFSPEQVEAQTIAPALRLNEIIHAAHPAAKVVFYETWGRKDGDSDNCRMLPAVCAYEGMQKRLDESYALMAVRSSAILAPVGEAWAKVRTEHPEIELYASDGIHPSLQGTYLAACVFYAVIFHKSPAGSRSSGVDRSEALLLQKAAESVVFDPSRPKGAPSGPPRPNP
jgi:hypothetical protein